MTAQIVGPPLIERSENPDSNGRRFTAASTASRILTAIAASRLRYQFRQTRRESTEQLESLHRTPEFF